MVVGSGLIAKRFQDYAGDDKVLIFASGVSNSKSTVEADYKREFDLLKKAMEDNKAKLVVYFSTCSILDPSENDSAYVGHKKQIEAFIQSNAKSYLIFRVSNLVGNKGNENTILNYIFRNIKGDNHFDVWQYATRNLIDADDLFAIINKIIQDGLFKNRIINIANNKSYTVPELVAAIEKHLNKKADYKIIVKGSSFKIDISDIEPIVEKLKINFNDTYVTNLLNKYYPVNEL